MWLEKRPTFRAGTLRCPLLSLYVYHSFLLGSSRGQLIISDPRGCPQLGSVQLALVNTHWPLFTHTRTRWHRRVLHIQPTTWHKRCWFCSGGNCNKEILSFITECSDRINKFIFFTHYSLKPMTFLCMCLLGDPNFLGFFVFNPKAVQELLLYFVFLNFSSCITQNYGLGQCFYDDTKTNYSKTFKNVYGPKFCIMISL